MSQICMNYQRGTSMFYSNNITQPRFEKNNQITRFSSSKEGQKITIQKGTKTIWISKKINPAIPNFHKILVVNRGTRRLDVESIT